MKQELKFKPPINSYSEILRVYNNASPLTCDNINMLWRNENRLSSAKLDPVLNYYLKHLHRKPDKKLTLNLPAEKITNVTLHDLKTNLLTLLHDNISHVDLEMTFEQYLKFKALGLEELIYWHRLDFFARAPLLAGSLPALLYFQWGRIFAVVNFEYFHPENKLKGNVHLYLEDMKNRNLYECIKEYTAQHKQENILKQQLTQEYAPQKILVTESTYHTPRPTFSYFHHEDGKDK